MAKKEKKRKKIMRVLALGGGWTTPKAPRATGVVQSLPMAKKKKKEIKI
jgi:hypothetical protein